MLGSGVFTTSGFLLADLKAPWLVLVAWCVGGVVALLGALSYGALARRIPESGGEYVFLSRTVHPSVGYVGGWVSLLAGFSAPLAAAAFAFGEYTRDWFPGLSPVVTGTLLLTGMSVLHAWDVRRGALVQNLTVLIKVILITGLIGLGVAQIPDTATVRGLLGEPPSPFPVTALAMSFVWVSFSYAGWNAAIYVGGEVADPERTLPRSLLAGSLLVTALYLAVNAVFVLAVPANLIAGRLDVGRIAAAHLGGARWATLATVLIATALLTTVSSQIMAGPRVYARMAADGFLPAWLRPREGPPRAAIVFQWVLAVVLLWTASYQSLLTFIGFTLSLSNVVTVLGLIRLRQREGREFSVLGWPWLPVTFVVAVLGIAILSMAQAPLPSLAGFGLLGLGWCSWWLSARSGPVEPPSKSGAS